MLKYELQGSRQNAFAQSGRKDAQKEQSISGRPWYDTCLPANGRREIMYYIDPPNGVVIILDILRKHGFEAYAVGGCVRDSIMVRTPKDWDIATDAHPEQICGLFGKTIDTGIKHGTVTVILDKMHYEVTTFRIDGRYTDGRHPEEVEFTSGLQDDLRRRDFTINSMAWNPEGGIIDPFGGINDITNRIIRTVGDPGERFSEDALRMLRAVRFAAALGFEIEAGTLEGIKENSSKICKISAERIREELAGILASDAPEKFVILRHTGLLRYILPELDVCFDTDRNQKCIGEHCLRSAAAVEADPLLRWAMLLHDVGRCSKADADPCKEEISTDTDLRREAADPSEKITVYTNLGRGLRETAVSSCTQKSIETADMILSRLKFDNKSKKKILRLIRHLEMYIEAEQSAVARAILEAGEDIFSDLLKVKKAHLVALQGDEHTARSIMEQNPVTCSRYGGKVELDKLDRVQSVFSSLMESGLCFGLKSLAINGSDLRRLGLNEGKCIGDILVYLLDRVIDEPGLNNKDILADMALEYLKGKQH